MAQHTLGSLQFPPRSFQKIDEVFQEFYTEEFQKLADRKRSDLVNKALLQLIQQAPMPAFLLSEALGFIERVDRENLLQHYIFTSFELWLNQYSGLSEEENYLVRAKIMGKYVPREDYQVFFPIGMGKVFPGTHFVTAHKSPDLDTTIASFWGWVDAFAARVGSGSHIWNVPGGPPSQIEMDLLFRQVFGAAVFTHLPKTRTILSLSGNDLMTQKPMMRKTAIDTLQTLKMERGEKAVVIVDKDGYYLGDFRSIDVASVRQVLNLLNQCLRWFENTLHMKLIGLFAKKDVHIKDIHAFIQEMFGLVIADCEQTKEFSSEEKEHFSLLLQRAFHIEKGIFCTFQDIGMALAKTAMTDFQKVRDAVFSLQTEGLFSSSGKLLEDRPKIFATVEKIIGSLHSGIQKIRAHTDHLGLVNLVKKEVLGLAPNFVSVRADVEEILSKMGSYQFLTVVYPDQDRFFPVGVIAASDLRQNVLGTVSLRDFSSRSEMTIPSYLDVISIIDHHKSELITTRPIKAIITDDQSTNTAVAEQAFILNDRHTTSGLDEHTVKTQLQSVQEPAISKRLWNYQAVFSNQSSFYIHPEREMLEYLHFLYGILDDTDLLSKVSAKDVEIMASLLNRLKTLSSKKEMQIIDLSDLPRNETFPQQAAKKILRNEDMYSLYKKVYLYREKEIEKQLVLAANDEPSTLFADTKEINRLARVGQTKIFAKNVASLEKYKHKLQTIWYEASGEFFLDHPDTDLYLHMISTIVSADEVYTGSSINYIHQDELWVWAAPTEIGVEHLKRFLSAFQRAPELMGKKMQVSFLGNNADALHTVFQESFAQVDKQAVDSDIPIAVIHYEAGLVNSRKSMISPYLPVLSK